MPDPSPDTPVQALFYGLVPCAGEGSRAGPGRPKQYRILAGRPMVQHTLAALAAVDRLTLTLVVLARGDVGPTLPPGRFASADCGGDTRARTVLAGLAALRQRGAREEDWVLVHDAARCLVTPGLVDRLIDACRGDAVGGLLAHPVADTLKRQEGGRTGGTLARAGLWLAQTPQMFRLGVLARALAAADADVSDEAGAMEAQGHRPLLVPGASQNFKVTYPEDFALAEAVLRSRQP
jgi:2-C-methyl-D-erythritol 4-phosphate cytidylyltransferase